MTQVTINNSTSDFIPIPVTRKNIGERNHADVTLGSTKHGDALLIFSPACIAAYPHLAVGQKVSVAYSPSSQHLRIAAGAEGEAWLRKVRNRKSFVGAGELFMSADSLQETFPRPQKRVALTIVEDASSVGDVLLLEIPAAVADSTE